MHRGQDNMNRGRSGYRSRGNGGNFRGRNPDRGDFGGSVGAPYQRLGLPVRQDRGRGRFNAKQYRGGNRQVVSSRYNNANAIQPEKSWFRINIRRGRDFGKEAIIKALSSHVDSPLMPYSFTFTPDGSATFLVDDRETADSISAGSRRISAPNGQRLFIKVDSCAAPCVPLDAASQEIIKKVLQTRYDSANQHLNLSGFVLDPALQEHRASNLSLQRNNVMMSIVTLIGGEPGAAERITSIDISDNRLRFLDYFSNLTYRLPNVTRLIMHRNQIDGLAELDKLSSWNITELDLSNNPLSDHYRDKTAYVSDIRRIFPKITLLDNTPVPPEARFGLDVDEASTVLLSLPPFKPSFFVNENIEPVITQFITRYYTIFDSEDTQQRQHLLEAYDDEATFTMSAINLTHEAHNERGNSWGDLTRDSHNIVKQTHWERFRAKLVQKGKLAILSYLCNNFPRTSHIPESFVTDISYASWNVLCVNLSGAFRDITIVNQQEQPSPIQFFNRVFLVLQTEKGLCVTNDELFISTLTEYQYNTYLSEIKRSQTAVQAASASATTAPPPAPVTDPKEAMVLAFASESGMRSEWARKCLEDYEWDYAKAAEAFTTLRLSGSIPASAFQ